MAHNVDGAALKGSAVGTISGWIVLDVSESASGGEEEITDENGDHITELNGFGIKTDVTIQAIPKSGTATPAINALFPFTSQANGAQTFRIKTLESSETPTGALKYTLGGSYKPNITPT